MVTNVSVDPVSGSSSVTDRDASDLGRLAVGATVETGQHKHFDVDIATGSQRRNELGPAKFGDESIVDIVKAGGQVLRDRPVEALVARYVSVMMH